MTAGDIIIPIITFAFGCIIGAWLKEYEYKRSIQKNTEHHIAKVCNGGPK